MTEKIYIFMRRDLKMRRGKEIAQACHAVMGLKESSPSAVITLKAASEDDLLGIERMACKHGRKNHLVRDAGLTELAPGTLTCIAVLGEPGDGQFREWELY
jgi:PTH2 family peptidyl-tRNA hydrolase